MNWSGSTMSVGLYASFIEPQAEAESNHEQPSFRKPQMFAR
jgi:hypothetical protein